MVEFFFSLLLVFEENNKYFMMINDNPIEEISIIVDHRLDDPNNIEGKPQS